MEFGPYRIDGELGRGGAGVVLRGRAPDGSAVAVKVLLHPERASALERFVRERDVLEQLARGGGFVPLLDAGMSPKGPYLVMPFLPGGTLRARMGRDPWPIDEVCHLGRTLARALGRAHTAGIVHRDLKPENVLFDDRGRSLIADLGLAKHLAEAQAAGKQGITQTGTIAGTVGYMPPEQMLDAKHAGPRADVFALGAVLYECLTGTAAFAGSSPVEVVNRMLSGGLTPLAELRPETPAPLRDVIERCLDPEPDERYRDGAALAAALLRAEGAPRTVRRRSGRPALLALGLAAGGVALTLAAVLARSGPQATSGEPSAPAQVVPPRVVPPRVVPPRVVPPRADGRAAVASAVAVAAPTIPLVDPVAATATAPPVRLGSLVARVAGLGGLELRRTVGSDELRFAAPIRFVAATADDVLAVDARGFVRAFRVTDLRQRFAYRMSSVAPTAFAVAPDGSTIALAMPGGIVVVPGGVEPSAENLFRATLAPDAVVTALVLGSRPSLLVFAEGSKVRVIDLAAKQHVTTIEADAPVTALALAGARLVSGDTSGKLASWRVGARREDCVRERTVGTHGHEIACLALSSTGVHVAAADVTGTWAQWEVETSKVQSRMSLGEAGAPLAVRFLDGDAVVWGAMERAAVHWQVDDPRRCERLPLGRPSGLAAFSASGAREVFADPGGFILGVVDLEGRRELPPAAGHYAPVSGAAACDLGLYTIDATGRVLFWGNDGSMSPVHSTGLTADDPARALASVAAMQDGRALAIGGQRAFLLDRAGSAPRQLEEPGLTWVTTAAEGDRFLAGTRSGEVLWLDPAGGVLERRATFTGRVLQVLAVGATVLALGEDDEHLVLAAWGPAAELRTSVSAARPGALAGVAGGRVVLGTESGQLWVYATSGAKRTVRVSTGHQGPVLWLASSPDARVLLSAGDDDTLAAWRVGEEGGLALIERRALDVSGDRVRSMIPLVDGRLLLGTARGVGALCRWGG